MNDYSMLINLVYVVSATLFIFGLKLLSHPSTARKGNMLSAVAMLLAVVVTMLDHQILSFELILACLVIGSAVGVYAARKVEMTSMPELVSLFNGIGGLASLAVAYATLNGSVGLSVFVALVSFLALLIGAITFSGSVVAWAKLSERIVGRPIIFKGQVIANIVLIIGLFVCGALISLQPNDGNWHYIAIGLALVMGIMLVLPIGGADMPVVISLLNSYSGLAACAAGFALENNLLIVAGALVGASGIILTNIMCKAMNRSLINVVTSGFKPVVTSDMKIEGEIKPLTAEDAFYVLEAAQSVLVIPGYGMAVAQAQHAMKELQGLIEGNGAEVAYAIHPVAGRMPGHMNVLLAEADVSYEQLFEMDEINPRIEGFDVAIVIGANDVVNPAAREMEGSPIYGMPVINVDLAKNVFVLKRGMAAGFAGIDNPLFFKDNTRMIFGDAKETLTNLVRQFAD
ncbi:NAD(P)(+) transhydrogenase (Re/Si-specific) subunit beta [Psychrosphaera sp. B3R10]|uniref:NAD(P)(+) transhydrogenase (Re/Si-specific) subunit beta n=1 Tax=unclassified Psychrosphaera TaxID=2641570 RepID=UPI001C08D625|nr:MULTISPECIES: NAD(P)(+) transhydrogenase (Re/Si-specific) subunit beta [unclassified Psychrosphaera]MBU2883547.1 NAD(P)(+) transhydrogenase (Re/Si-specific) subunit beta [Psychrosphaera sp. I2R16]MBU2989726.1 NAD(P)(+) transhydrogenase (Re/Si-specific) subunit beta [Psychrosphaera sp. B3R10]MDO6719819.1 NAD(P)(+) transhydrogenase (Re/Si-specific) subunit beta [Psychrosphaera sp. 1_MG-2023]